MGVVRKRVVVEYTHDNGEGQDTTGTQSETESISHSETPSTYYPRRRNRPRKCRIYIVEDVSSMPGNHSGKRKVRRYANTKTLEIYLRENEENEDNLLEYYKGPFARLMDITEEPLEILNKFSDDFQEETETSKRKRDNSSPFLRISHKIRRTIKIRKNFPLDLMEDLESELLGFFKANPSEIYCVVPSKSFERLLYHAISQYHRLNSISLIKDTSVSVEIFNEHKLWVPEEIPLTKYIISNNIIN